MFFTQQQNSNGKKNTIWQWSHSKQSRALTINHGKEVLSSCSTINQQQNKTAGHSTVGSCNIMQHWTTTTKHDKHNAMDFLGMFMGFKHSRACSSSTCYHHHKTLSKQHGSINVLHDINKQNNISMKVSRQGSLSCIKHSSSCFIIIPHFNSMVTAWHQCANGNQTTAHHILHMDLIGMFMRFKNCSRVLAQQTSSSCSCFIIIKPNSSKTHNDIALVLI